MKPAIDVDVTIGILALQGAFIEHQTTLQNLSRGGGSCRPLKLQVVQVRLPSDLLRCDALVIPGGESTTIALLARLSGLTDPLREFIETRPVWGTCAGAILLSEKVIGGTGDKRGGKPQELLGGISIGIQRNGWGSQLESFEAPLEVEGMRDPFRPFIGVFIRAPVVHSLIPASVGKTRPPIQILARIPSQLLPADRSSLGNSELSVDDEPVDTVVALRQGLHLLTTFHPELTPDNRFHEYFVRECVLPAVNARRGV